jgi:serine/threonine-protein kinase
VKSPVQNEHSQGMSYQRLLPLGAGGMAKVYLALALGQSGFKRLVVVKSVREELLANPAMRQMFLTEARVSARLNHPNVVQVSDVVDSPDGVMLVMEYLDGLSLSATYSVVGKAFSLPMRLRVACEVLAGLQYAHELADYSGAPLGLVHRDVSPQNVFLTYDGRVKVLDFGIAKVGASQDQTRFGVIKGRIAYMPPEQIMGQRVDLRADIYAMGCLLWEAVAGQRLWEKLPEPEIAKRVVAGQVRRLGQEVNPELERIVSRAMAYSPDKRYSSAEEMRIELEGFLNSVSPVMLREVGQLLTAVCKERLDQRQREIAEAISRVEKEFATLEAQAEAGESASRTGWTSGVTSGTPASSRTGSDMHSKLRSARTDAAVSVSAGGVTPVRRRRSRGRGVWVALGTAALVLAGVLFMPGRGTAPQSPALAAPASTGVSATRTITITARPEGARVFVDDEPVVGNPAVVKVPHGSAHAIRLELEGHESSERAVVVDADTSLTIELTPESSASAPSPIAPESAPSGSRRTRQRNPAFVARPAPSGPAKSGTADKAKCDPPYYFSEGIKTYKPECI